MAGRRAQLPEHVPGDVRAFFPAKVPELAAAGWRAHGYLRPGATGPGVAAVERILAGRIRNDWIDQFNRRPVAHRRLIKDIRANFMLGWIRARYPAMPIVFLMRHPVPTVLSQLKAEWNPKFKNFLLQQELLADQLEPFRADIEAMKDPFEERVLIWCMMNLVPLRQFSSGGMRLVFYEEVCRRHEEILPGLFAYIGVRYTGGVARKLNQPSSMASPFSAIRNGREPVEDWVGQVTPDQMRSAMALLKRFGLDRIYGESGMPLVKAEEAPGLFKAASA